MSWFIASTAFIIWVIIAVHSIAKQIGPNFTKDWIRSRDPVQNIAYLALIFQMGSPNNGLAIEAVRSLREKGWLFDGSLKQITLKNANLQEASLSNADLQKTNLQNANLSHVNLQDANLQDANLFSANLQDANLSHVNFQNVDLTFANLKNANLSYANLENALLSYTNLQGAIMTGTKLNRVKLGYRESEGIIRVTANFQNASYNLATKYVAPTEFPDGFDPELFGMKKVMIVLADPPTVPN